MRVTFSLLIEKLKASFWVVPAAVAVAIVIALFWLQSIQVNSQDSSLKYFLLYDASPQGARLILSSIATAVMTVVGVLFSITVVVLQQVSSQYAPRVIQNFIRSTPSQIVLGFFIGTFCYCLLLLRKIHDTSSTFNIKIPALAMSFGIVLAVLCLCLLILYVHHITQSIQSTRIITGITQQTLETIENIVKDRKQYPFKNSPDSNRYPHELLLHADRHGYLQLIAWKQLKRILGDHIWYAEALRVPGDYLQSGVSVLRICGNARVDDKLQKRLLRVLEIGSSRTNAQDPHFGIRQLVDIGLRALSPGINDPSTAAEAINGIGAILLLFAENSPIPEMMQFDPERFVQTRGLDGETVVGLCLDQLIQFGSSHLPVLSLIAENIQVILERTQDQALKQALELRQKAISELLLDLRAKLPWSVKQPALRISNQKRATFP